MKIDYDHSRNLHSREGPRSVFHRLLRDGLPSSVLDVGCGTGTWLRAALDCGLTDVLGIDGASIPAEQLLVQPDQILQKDLTTAVDLGRKFALVLCLEVAEHLEECHSGTLLDTLTRHSDCIVFSAACPGQPGQHHVNCKWPAWWQQGFNERGYVCDDAIRWRLWDETRLEPWYRQNIFRARKDPGSASREPRLNPAIHPEMLPFLITEACMAEALKNVDSGSMPPSWYIVSPARAFVSKARRKLSAAITSRE